jgi:hypothetical protein
VSADRPSGDGSGRGLEQISDPDDRPYESLGARPRASATRRLLAAAEALGRLERDYTRRRAADRVAAAERPAP